MAGTFVLKIGAKGKPLKRHLRLSDDLKRLEWLPSKKRDGKGYILVDDIAFLQVGRLVTCRLRVVSVSWFSFLAPILCVRARMCICVAHVTICGCVVMFLCIWQVL